MGKASLIVVDDQPRMAEFVHDAAEMAGFESRLAKDLGTARGARVVATLTKPIELDDLEAVLKTLVESLAADD